MIKYEAETYHLNPYRTESHEYDTKPEAVAFIEAAGKGRVITWHVGPNLPGALPELKYSSCALDVYENGAWRGVNIF